jgi:hypothetical protein
MVLPRVDQSERSCFSSKTSRQYSTGNVPVDICKSALKRLDSRGRLECNYVNNMTNPLQIFGKRPFKRRLSDNLPQRNLACLHPAGCNR